MATMIPDDIEEFVTEGEKAFYPGSGKPRPLAGMSPHLGVSQVPRRLPVGLHKFLEGVAKPDAYFLCWYTPDINGKEPDFLLYCEDVVSDFSRKGMTILGMSLH